MKKQKKVYLLVEVVLRLSSHDAKKGFVNLVKRIWTSDAFTYSLLILQSVPKNVTFEDLDGFVLKCSA